jgi:CRP-like cAMP-binding protein
LLRGFLVRELTTEAGRVSATLFGPEDVIQPDGAAPEVTVLQHTATWTAITDTRLALLDERFFERTARWPELPAALLERTGRAGQRLALQGAVATLQSVDARVLASLWIWASQWATVAGQGVVLRVPLSHERLARLIHARRPTVTSAVGRLRRAGLVQQRRDGSWLLHGPHPANAAKQANGVSMPVLAEMFTPALGVRKRQDVVSGSGSRALAARELKTRLEEQRKVLQEAAARHEEMLERMRRETQRLAATGATVRGSRR